MIIIMTTNERHARMKNNDDDVDDVDDVVDVDAATKWKSTKKRLHFFRNFAFSNFFFSYLRSKFFLAFGFSIFQNDLFHPPPLPQPRAARPHPPPLQVQLPNGVLRTSINLSGRAKRQKSCNYTLKDVGVIFFFKVASFKGKQIEVRQMHLVELLVGQVVTR